MKITNVEVIKFRVTDEFYRKHHRWGYGCPPEDKKVGGVESKQDFLHLTSIKIYNDLIKKY